MNASTWSDCMKNRTIERQTELPGSSKLLVCSTLGLRSKSTREELTSWRKEVGQEVSYVLERIPIGLLEARAPSSRWSSNGTAIFPGSGSLHELRENEEIHAMKKNGLKTGHLRSSHQSTPRH